MADSTYGWYILKVMPSQELRIRDDLKSIMQSPHLKEMIKDVVVITEMKKMKNGEIKKRIHKDFRTFVFVKMILSDTTYNAVKISGVRHILGTDEPVPMTDEEAKKLFSLSVDKPKDYDSL